MNDILPPKRPLNPRAAGTRSSPPPVAPPKQPPIQPVQSAAKKQKLIDSPPTRSLLPSRTRSSKKKWIWLFVSVVVLLLAALAAAIGWYTTALQPVNAQATEKVQVHIAEGSSPSQISQLLQDEGVIRSSLAFDIYVQLAGVRGQLQAGAYNLSPSESTQEIATHLTSGNVDLVTVTFLPGATLAENRQVLLAAGFSETEVDTALAKQYDSPLFAGKPTTADLEGYIYGETYTFPPDITVEEVLQRSFDEFWQVIEENNIVSGFQAQGLDLFEGITLASIVQREDADPDNQKQIAQVFYNRLQADMNLGSDVTYYYGAKKLGVEPSSDLDTPYNTRIYPGLPPGPISSPGLSALIATANPSQGEYLYFISGDDDMLYTAMTNEEHEENVRQHCAVKCQLP